MYTCRICMNKDISMLNIFDGNDIVDRIYFCTGIQLKNEDSVPSEICNNCLENLSVAHKFKSLCLLAEETFNTLSSRIKTEPELLETDLSEGVEADLVDISSTKDEPVEKKVISEDCDGFLKPKSNSRRSPRVKLKYKECVTDLDVNPLRKRGTYTKGTKRVAKFKFRKLFCEPCGLKFDTKQLSDEHKRDVHEDERFVCEICGKVFKHRASHYTHVRSHQPPKHACDRCDYRTCQKHDLVKHLRIHTGVKLYQCEYCTASYHTSSNLTCHIRRYHEGVRRFSCTICERGFYDRTKLNRHLDSHNDIKRFKCDVCHACFTRRCYWKKHMQREHNIEVPPQRPGRQKTNRLVGELPNGAVEALTAT